MAGNGKLTSKEFWQKFMHDSNEELQEKIIEYRNQKPVFLDFITDKELFKEAVNKKYIEIDEERKLTAMLPHTPEDMQFKLLDYLPKKIESFRCGGRNLNDFITTARGAGLVIDQLNTTTDKWHRCPVEGKPLSNTSGSYRIEDKGSHYYCVGINFVTGQTAKFSTLEKTANIPYRTNAALIANSDMYTQARIEAQNDISKKRAQDAKELYRELDNATGLEPYATKKQLTHLRMVKKLPTGEIVIPLFNVQKEMSSLQVLTPDGKFLMKGGVKTGAFAVVGTPLENPKNIVIGEGFATVDSALSAFKQGSNDENVMGFAAVDCHNMRNVVAVLSQHYKNAQIYLALDNDKKGERNVGIEAGEYIVRETPNIKCLIPDMGEKACDWNDLYLADRAGAIEQMRSQIFKGNDLQLAYTEAQERKAQVEERISNALSQEVGKSSPKSELTEERVNVIDKAIKTK